jgi:hypothetical protein
MIINSYLKSTVLQGNLCHKTTVLMITISILPLSRLCFRVISVMRRLISWLSTLTWSQLYFKVILVIRRLILWSRFQSYPLSRLCSRDTSAVRRLISWLSTHPRTHTHKNKTKQKTLLSSAGQNVASLLSLPNPSLKDWTKRGNCRHPILSGLPFTAPAQPKMDTHPLIIFQTRSRTNQLNSNLPWPGQVQLGSTSLVGCDRTQVHPIVWLGPVQPD